MNLSEYYAVRKCSLKLLFLAFSINLKTVELLLKAFGFNIQQSQPYWFNFNRSCVIYKYFHKASNGQFLFNLATVHVNHHVYIAIFSLSYILIGQYYLDESYSMTHIQSDQLE